MMPVGLFRRNAARFDLRNHRKIVVVDGRVGYTGSQNIVNPDFVKGYPNEELMVRVTGPVVAELQAMFLADHYFETGKVLEPKELFPESGLRRKFACSGPSKRTWVRSGKRTGTHHRDVVCRAGTNRHHHPLFRAGRAVPASHPCGVSARNRSASGVVNAREPEDYPIRTKIVLR